MNEIRADGFRQMPLRAHSLLAGIPLRTLSRVDLPGGRRGMTIADLRPDGLFRGAPNARVAVGVDAARFRRMFRGRLGLR